MQTMVSRFGHERKGRPLWLIADSTLSNSNMVSMSHRSNCNPFSPELNRPGFQLLPVYISGSIKLFVRNQMLLLQLPCLLLQHSILFLYDAKPAGPNSGARLGTESVIYVVHMHKKTLNK